MDKRRNHPVNVQTVLRIAAVVLVVVLTGCGQKIVPVAGVVRLDGKPLDGAGVAFHAAGGGPMASAVTDAEGRYRLETGNAKGAVPGEYRVTVTKQTVSGFGSDGVMPGPGGYKIKWLVPEKYVDVKTTPLAVTVPSQSYDFELTSSR